MTCGVCNRVNLPGGVRCTYCGSHYPPALEFDEGVPATGADTAPEEEPLPPRKGAARSAGIVGLLAVLALKGKSILTLLKLGKLATTLGSMFVFVAAEARFFGWQLAVGVAVSIFVHEMGHVFVNWRKGLKQSAPMFIPFLGAVILVKRFPDDPEVQADCGAGGPSAGMLAALTCLGMAALTRDSFWLVLAQIGFVINLFNLIPVWQLDGAHMVSVFSPIVWNGVLVVLLLWAVKASAHVLWLLLIIAFLVRLARRGDDRWVLAAPAARWRMGVVYLVLCIGLSYGMQHAADLRPVMQQRAAGASARSRDPLAVHSDAPSRNVSVPRTASPPASEPEIRDADLRLIINVIWGILLFAPTLIWTATSMLLRRAAGRKQSVTVLVLPLWMTVCGLAAFGVCALLSPVGHRLRPPIGALWASSAAALVYALIAALTVRPDGPRPALAPSTVRALAWALGGALFVVYVTEEPVLLAIVAAAAVAFMLRYPWAWHSAVAGLRLELGDVEGALREMQRAADLRPDPETEALLLSSIARANLALKRGEPALAALERRRALADAVRPGTPVVRSVADLALEAAALGLLERFDEALDRCEQILPAAASEQAARGRYLTVRICLAEIARMRGWADEALAQAEWCLAALHSKARHARGLLRALRAVCLTDLGKLDAAVHEAARAERSARDPAVETSGCLVRARAALAAGNAAEALRHLARAEKLRAGDLEVRYWRGLARREACDASGDEELRALADEHPRELWGRRAAAVPAS